MVRPSTAISYPQKCTASEILSMKKTQFQPLGDDIWVVWINILLKTLLESSKRYETTQIRQATCVFILYSQVYVPRRRTTKSNRKTKERGRLDIILKSAFWLLAHHLFCYFFKSRLLFRVKSFISISVWWFGEEGQAVYTHWLQSYFSSEIYFYGQIHFPALCQNIVNRPNELGTEFTPGFSCNRFCLLLYGVDTFFFDDNITRLAHFDLKLGIFWCPNEKLCHMVIWYSLNSPLLKWKGNNV